ncbi:hypothetical protein ACFLVX_04320 [Chloroflexota bacterium]
MYNPHSFKGTTYKEYMWSQRKALPAIAENNDTVINLSQHPQVQGLMNILENISKNDKDAKGFKDCVSVTIEKGIDHDPMNKLRLNYPEAFKWDLFADRLNIEFSDVINCFDLNFGWNLSAKIHRYTNRGAVIKLTNGSETIDTLTTAISDLTNFRKVNLGKEDYMTLVYPVEQIPKLHKEGIASKPSSKSSIPLTSHNYWVITGSENNLKVSLEHGLWGVKSYHADLWDKVHSDDQLLFYCTSPVSGIIGYGIVIEKHVDHEALWPNEDPKKESKYPLRVKFRTAYLVDDWKTGRIPLISTGIRFYDGLNYIEQSKIPIAKNIIAKIGTALV